VLLIMYLGGYQLSDVIACNRKVTIASRAVADLVARSGNGHITASQVDTILNATTQIMYPYDASKALIRVSELTTNPKNGKTTVTWSRASDGTSQLRKNKRMTLPTQMVTVAEKTSLIYGEVIYTYKPSFKYGLTKTVTLTQGIYMVPRNSTQVIDDDF
jgi:Flp pilus assembly protein TadG